MVNELMLIVGGVGGSISMLSLVGAGIQTVKLVKVQHPVDIVLQELYDGVTSEPVPADMVALVHQLGGDSNGPIDSTHSACS